MASRVTIIGCGALGSLSADLLTRAGVGELTIVDRDIVELHNLQRQTLFTEEDARRGMPKAEAAKAHLRLVNSQISINAFVADVNYTNIRGYLEGRTIVIDGSDNFEVRQLINDASLKYKVPWVYGGAVSAYGMVKGVLPGEGSCFRCLMDGVPAAGESPTCETAGIIAPASASVSALQVSIALKYMVTGEMDMRLHSLDLWNAGHRSIAVPRLAECPACGGGKFRYLEGEIGGRAAELCGRNTVQVLPARETELDLHALLPKLEKIGPVTNRKYYLSLEDGGLTTSIFPDGRCLVHGTNDVRRARATVSKYLGG